MTADVYCLGIRTSANTSENQARHDRPKEAPPMAVDDIPVRADTDEGLITHCQLHLNASTETLNPPHVIIANRLLAPFWKAVGRNRFDVLLVSVTRS